MLNDKCIVRLTTNYCISMNEATLEARIDQVLRKVFPTFKEVSVEHQTSFSLKIGHHNIDLNSKLSNRNSVRGISDILFKIGNDNIILLELKREKVSISPDDISQGLSYARLLEQMPPLTLISNGKDNRFFNTYTREELNVDTIDFQFIQDSIDSSFEWAVNDFKDAVNLLLNNDPELFSQVINQISSEKFERIIGDVTDFNKPICLDFNVERTILNEISNLFDQGNPLIGIKGSAFSGKTVLLYQFYKKERSHKNCLLFLDCNDHNYSIYRQLANSFSKSSKVLVKEDQIKDWLISSLHNESNYRLYLLLDNFNNNIPESIKEEIIELIDLFNDGRHRILYTIDEFNYKEIAYIPHRKYKTIIGEKSEVLKLDELDDIEYDAVNNLMFEKFHLWIENGGQYTPEYREPRILRYLVSINQKDKLPEGKFQRILAVPDYELLKLLSKNNTYSQEVHQLMKKLAICFLEEFDIRDKNSHLNIAASGSGAILVETFKVKFPHDYNELVKSSIIVIREYYSHDLSLIYPKLPELLAYYCIPSIVDMLLEKSKCIEMDKLISFFTSLMIAVPYCDIVGTGVLIKLSEIAPKLFSDLVQGLQEIPPKTESISKGTKILMHMEDLGNINIDFQSDINVNDSSFIADYFPYALLSQLAGYPMIAVSEDEAEPYNFHLNLLLKIGSDPHFLRRADNRSLRNMKYYESYNWDGVGQIVNGKEGILEPIVQSFQKYFMSFPDDMVLLYKFGFHENNFNLLYRFYLALVGLINYEDTNISNKALEYIKQFHSFFTNFMADYFSKKIEDRQEGVDLYNWLIKLDIEEELNRIILP